MGFPRPVTVLSLVTLTISFVLQRLMKCGLVSWSFEPSQPQRITSGLTDEVFFHVKMNLEVGYPVSSSLFRLARCFAVAENGYYGSHYSTSCYSTLHREENIAEV